MAKHVKRSTIPIYLVGVVWLVFGLFLSLSRPMDYVLCAVISIAAFVVGKAIFPDKHYQMPGQAEEKKEENKEEKKPEAPKSTGNPEIDNLIKERERALSEMRRLNDSIEDETISAQIDHLEEVTSKIIDQVIKEPAKLPQIRKFMSYYLPTTIKLLTAYDQMSRQGVSGENITGTMEKVERMMSTIVLAFEKQLDSLFGDEAMDISTDITVLENMMVREGLASDDLHKTARSAPQTQPPQDTDGGITLEL